MRKGFTLIEILIVVVIIGILMAVAVPTFKGRGGNRLGPAPTVNAMEGELLRYEDKTNGVTCYRVRHRHGMSCIKTSNTF